MYNRTVSFRPAISIGQKFFKLKNKADPLKMSHAVYKVGCKNGDKCYIVEITILIYV